VTSSKTVLNCRVDAFDFEESIANLVELVEAHKGGYHACLNAAKIVEAASNEWLRIYFRDAEMVSADGKSVSLAARLLNIRGIKRVAGIDLFTKLLEVGSLRKWRIFLVGSTESTLLKVNDTISHKYPGIEITGFVNGYDEFSLSKLPAIWKDLAPDICFFALPSPMKEKLMYDLRMNPSSTFLFGIGGSLEVMAGNLKRAPKWMQNIGFEWFFRLIQEPKRMAKRYLIGNSKFALLLILAIWQNMLNRSN